MNRKDYLIIGQGLAGSLLAYELMLRQKSVQIIDDSSSNISSKVAAGLYNPITGRKMVKTWMADEIFPNIEPYYRRIESMLKVKILHETEIYRPFISIEEYNDWVGRSSDDKFKGFVKAVRSTPLSESKELKNPYGGVSLAHGGYVDVKKLVSSFRDFFYQKKNYQQQTFDYEALEITEKGINYENTQYQKVIFCEGHACTKSKWFDWLPFKLVKGEIMTIAHSVTMDKIFNRGVFVIPLEKGISRVGATYDHHIEDLSPSEKAKTYLNEKLSSLISLEYKTIDHQVGIRPATLDRRPLIGCHPEHNRLGIFNGFGSKGVSLISYFAGHFADHLEKSEKLIPEVDIKRYFSLER